MLRRAVFAVAAGQGALRRLGVVDDVGFIEEIAGAAAVRGHKLQHGLPQVALAEGGKFQTDILQRDLRVLRVIGYGVPRREGALFRDGLQRLFVGEGELLPVVKLLRLAGGQYPEAIGGARSLQYKGGAVRSEGADHGASAPFHLFGISIIPDVVCACQSHSFLAFPTNP